MMVCDTGITICAVTSRILGRAFNVRQLKSVALRELLRETRKIKWTTDSGASFLVTNHGKLMWMAGPAEERADESRAVINSPNARNGRAPVFRFVPNQSR